MNRSVTQDFFVDEEGFTMPAMLIALLLVCALIFTSAQIYRINSRASEIQNVADACVLAAESQVAEFMLVVRIADALLLSLGLTSAVVSGLGLAALCTPVTAEMSPTLLSAGKKLLEARDSFAKASASALNAYQKLLPFLAASYSYVTGKANSGEDAQYFAYALLFSQNGKDIQVGSVEKLDEFQDELDEHSEEIRKEAQEAEEAAKRAEEYKREAFEHDCGLNPAYCMYERAERLAGMEGRENPLYTSVNTWSFSAALKRAQIYYRFRFEQEAPQDSSTEEQARSALRKRFYQYACEEMKNAFVRETEQSFEAFFPHLPSNTQEMRSTSLYTEAVYPISEGQNGQCMHAYTGCPGAAAQLGWGSIEQMEKGHFETCTYCQFSESSMGKVAAASSAIDNGFEYHYSVVAQAAKEYQAAQDELNPLKEKVKQKASGLFERLLNALSEIANARIKAEPPGSYGACALVVNIAQSATDTGFVSSFVQGSKQLGMRAALSSATLVEEPFQQGSSVLDSVLNDIGEKTGTSVGVWGIIMDCWLGLLRAYSFGIEALSSTLEKALNALPLASASGLGTWAAKQFESLLASVGLEPADLNYLKPVLVNSAHVASKDEGVIGSRLLSIKKTVVEHPLSSTDIFTSLLCNVQSKIDGFFGEEENFEIAIIELAEGEKSIPFSIVLPQSLRDIAQSGLHKALDYLRSVYAEVSGRRVWE